MKGAERDYGRMLLYLILVAIKLSSNLVCMQSRT